jgi:hypothetical protein
MAAPVAKLMPGEECSAAGRHQLINFSPLLIAGVPRF